MRLQIALDCMGQEEARELAVLLKDEADIIEVGTPLLLRYGLRVVTEIKALLPEKPIFADAKIVDAGRFETEEVAKSGADMVSVLAGASFHTLQEAQFVCKEYGLQLVVDTIDSRRPSGEKVEELQSIQPDFVVLHLPSDLAKTGKNLATEFLGSPWCSQSFSFMVAGGIHRDALPSILALLRPAIVVVGSAITLAPSPKREAQYFREVIHGFAKQS